MPAHLVIELCRLVKQDACAYQQRVTGGGQLDAFGCTHDERAAEDLLQIGNALADRRGDSVRALGRPRDAAGIRNGDEQLQVAQIELHGTLACRSGGPLHRIRTAKRV